MSISLQESFIVLNTTIAEKVLYSQIKKQLGDHQQRIHTKYFMSYESTNVAKQRKLDFIQEDK